MVTSIPQSCPRRILLGVTGGIAAYKSLDLIRRLKERGAKEIRLVCLLTAPEGVERVRGLTLSVRRAEEWELIA